MIITQSGEETQKFGEEFAVALTDRVIALYGELGSGKTTFVQGMTKGLGIKQRIISPTFVIVRQYKISPPRSPFGHLGGGEATTSTPARCNAFYHVDLYRIESKNELKGLGLEEIISDPQNIVAIEWAEKIKDLLPKKRIDIYFEYIDEHKRRITIKKSN